MKIEKRKLPRARGDRGTSFKGPLSGGEEEGVMPAFRMGGQSSHEDKKGNPQHEIPLVRRERGGNRRRSSSISKRREKKRVRVGYQMSERNSSCMLADDLLYGKKKGGGGKRTSKPPAPPRTLHTWKRREILQRS